MSFTAPRDTTSSRAPAAAAPARRSRRTAARGDTDFSMLSLVVLSPIQSLPEASLALRTGTTDGTLTPPVRPARRRTLPPVASAKGFMNVCGRDRVGEFRRIDRADMGKRRQVAIGDLIEADLLGLQAAGEDAGLGRGQRHGHRLAGRRDHLRRAGIVAHRLAAHFERHAAAVGGQPLLLEFRLLHQPVGDAAIERDMRAAAFEAARPEPALIGQAACRRGLRPCG